MLGKLKGRVKLDAGVWVNTSRNDMVLDALQQLERVCCTQVIMNPGVRVHGSGDTVLGSVSGASRQTLGKFWQARACVQACLQQHIYLESNA